MDTLVVAVHAGKQEDLRRQVREKAKAWAPSLTCSSCDLNFCTIPAWDWVVQTMVWSFPNARRAGPEGLAIASQFLSPFPHLFQLWLELLHDSCLGLGGPDNGVKLSECKEGRAWGFGYCQPIPQPLPSLVPIVTWTSARFLLGIGWSRQWCEAFRMQGGQGLRVWLLPANSSAPSLTCSNCDLNFCTIPAWDWVVQTMVWSFPNARRAGPEGLAIASQILSPFPHLFQLWLELLHDSCLGLGGQDDGVKLSECKEGRAWGFGHRRPAPQPLPSFVPIVTWTSERFLLGIGWSRQWCEAFRRQGGQGLRVWPSPMPEPLPSLVPIVTWTSESFLLGIGWSRQWCEAFRRQGGQGLRVWPSPASPSAPSLIPWPLPHHLFIKPLKPFSRSFGFWFANLCVALRWRLYKFSSWRGGYRNVWSCEHSFQCRDYFKKDNERKEQALLLELVVQEVVCAPFFHYLSWSSHGTQGRSVRSQALSVAMADLKQARSCQCLPWWEI